MSKLRFSSIKESNNRNRIAIEEKGRRSELFGINVFNEDKMLQFLTREAYDRVKGAM